MDTGSDGPTVSRQVSNRSAPHVPEGRTEVTSRATMVPTTAVPMLVPTSWAVSLSAHRTLLDESRAGRPSRTPWTRWRALAARLGGGVASIHWYVSSRDELLDRAADHVLRDVLAAVSDIESGDAIEDLRTMAVISFDAIVDRPWLSAYFMRDTGVQPNALRLYEKLGEQVLRLDLTPRQRFNAVSAVVGFVVGTAADMSQEPPQAVRPGEIGPHEHLAAALAQWRALDPQEFPFVHHIIDEFAGHNDSDQFRAGLDLLLDGRRLQAEA